MNEIRRRGDHPALTRLSVNINKETTSAISELMARHDTNATEVVRHAIAILKYIEDEVRLSGRTVQIGRGDEVIRLDLAEWET